jgi:hypothetical protein
MALSGNFLISLDVYSYWPTAMTPDERESLHSLCARIAEEKDPTRFLQLVEELNTLLDQKERLAPPAPQQTKVRAS